MSCPVSSPAGWIMSEALVRGLAGDAQLAGDLGPGVSPGSGPGDGGGEVVLGLAGGGVGFGDPAEDAGGRAGRQGPGGGAFAEGGACFARTTRTAALGRAGPRRSACSLGGGPGRR